MTTTDASKSSYFARAAGDQHNVILIFGAISFAIAFASRLPLQIGGAAELLWLTIGPRLASFRAWVDEQSSAQYLARAETAVEGALAQLPEIDRDRFMKLTRHAAELAAEARGQLPRRELTQGLHALLELRRTFLDYAFLQQRLETLLEPTPAAQLEQEAARLQQSFSAERDLASRLSIRQAVFALNHRMAQQSAFAGVARTISARLAMLESIPPSLSQLVWKSGHTRLKEEIERALAEVGSTEPLELAIDEILAQPRPSLVA